MFKIKGATERKIYEIVRKHCGYQKEWSISLENLREKTGSTSSLNTFRFKIKKIQQADSMLEYSMSLVKKNNQKGDLVEKVVFQKRNQKSQEGLIDIPSFKKETIEKGQRLVEESGLDLDYYEIRSQFISSLNNSTFLVTTNCHFFCNTLS